MDATRALKSGDEVCKIHEGRLFFGTITSILTGSVPPKVIVSWVRPPDIEIPKEQFVSDLNITDRPLYRGCKVRKVGDESGLIGVCRAIHLKADLRILGTNSVISSVNLERFTPLKEYKQKSVVYKNGWLGIITNVKRKAVVRAVRNMFGKDIKHEDNFVCFKAQLIQARNNANQIFELPWISEQLARREFGAQLELSKEGVLRLDKITKDEHCYFVEDLEVDSVEVVWKYQVDAFTPDAPPTTFKSAPGKPIKDLKIIKEDLSDEASFQVGNLGRIQIKVEDFYSLQKWDRKFVTENLPQAELANLYKEYTPTLWYYFEDPEKRLEFQSTCVVMIHHLMSTGDIMWQNNEMKFERSTDIENISVLEDLMMHGDFVHCQEFMKKSFKKVYGVITNNDLKAKKITIKVFTNTSPAKHLETIQVPSKLVKPHERYRYCNLPDTICVKKEEDKIRVGHVQGTNLMGKISVHWSDVQRDEWCWPADCSFYFIRGHDLEVIFSQIDFEEDGEDGEGDKMEIDPPAPVSCPTLPSAHSGGGDEAVAMDTNEVVNIFQERVEIVEECPPIHKFFASRFEVASNNLNSFIRVVQRELRQLKELCPEIMKTKAYGNRTDLFSIAIAGTEETPYEDSLYLFDASLPSNYPNTPPLVHFHSCGAGRLNPNLYAEGKVCVSLLGTWSGTNSTEKWTNESSLAQVLISIQALILVKEPYHNEPGFDRSKYPTEAEANRASTPYTTNLMPLVGRMMINQLQNPFDPWKDDIKAFYKLHIPLFISRWEKWLSGKKLSDTEKPPFSIDLTSATLKNNMQAIFNTLRDLHSKL